MKESMTYQHILAEGRQEGIAQGIAQGIERGRQEAERELLLLLGTDRFGPLPQELQGQLEAAHEPQLKALARRLLTASSWQELLLERETDASFCSN